MYSANGTFSFTIYKFYTVVKQEYITNFEVNPTSMTFHNNPAIVKLNMLERREREGEREKER